MSFSEYGGWSWRKTQFGWEKIPRPNGDEHFQSIGGKDFFVVIGNPELVAIGAWKYSAGVYVAGLPTEILIHAPDSARGSICDWQYGITYTRYPTNNLDERKHQGTMFWLRSPEGVEEIGICGSCLGEIPNWRAWMIGTNKPHISERRALLKVTSWLENIR